MRRRSQLSVVTLVAVAVVVAGVGSQGTAAPGAPATGGRLTFAAWTSVGFGTGTVYSPSALCEASSTAPRVVRLSENIGALSDPAWTRSGSTLAYVDATGRRSRLQVTAAGTWKPRTVVTGPVRSPAWSPDGDKLAYVSLGADRPGVYVINTDGSGNRRVFAGTAAYPSWSPNGTQIAFEASGIRVMNADGSGATTIADGWMPAWSSTGDEIAFVAAAPGAAVGTTLQELYAVGADGRGRRRLTDLVERETDEPTETTLTRPAWSPDGSALAVALTVSVRGLKGATVRKRALYTVDAASGRASEILTVDGIGNPSWRPGAAISEEEGVARPCIIRGNERTRTLRGTADDDIIVGTDAPDHIVGRAGNDWIHGRNGRDTITPGPARDETWSGRGTDIIDTRDGAIDIVHCGEGASDTGTADRRDTLAGSCSRVTRR